MKIEKIKNTYNDYKLELSWGQLQTVLDALTAKHDDPVADELLAEWRWYMEQIPGPGVDPDEWKEKQERDEEEFETEESEIPMPSKKHVKSKFNPSYSETEDEELDTLSDEELESIDNLKKELVPEEEAEESLPEMEEFEEEEMAAEEKEFKKLKPKNVPPRQAPGGSQYERPVRPPARREGPSRRSELGVPEPPEV